MKQVYVCDNCADIFGVFVYTVDPALILPDTCEVCGRVTQTVTSSQEPAMKKAMAWANGWAKASGDE